MPIKLEVNNNKPSQTTNVLSEEHPPLNSRRLLLMTINHHRQIHAVLQVSLCHHVIIYIETCLKIYKIVVMFPSKL